MCGIVGIVGRTEVNTRLYDALTMLQHRGQDAAGIATCREEKVFQQKGNGLVKDVFKAEHMERLIGKMGIGHVRYPTAGSSSPALAQPFYVNSPYGISLAHNGNLTNALELRHKMLHGGTGLSSTSDTEVLVQLIDDIYTNSDVSAEKAVRLALGKVVGAYGLVILCKKEPRQLIAARKGSPLVIGVGEKENFVASDATPIIEFTKEVIYLEDEEVAVIKDTHVIIKTIHNIPKTP